MRRYLQRVALNAPGETPAQLSDAGQRCLVIFVHYNGNLMRWRIAKPVNHVPDTEEVIIDRTAGGARV